MNAAAASALSITIKLLSWSLRRDAEKFAAPVRGNPRFSSASSASARRVQPSLSHRLPGPTN
jgi:hypothetical protein